MGTATLVAVVVWFANHLGGVVDLQVGSDDFSLIVSELYGPAGMVEQYDGRFPAEAVLGALVVVLMISASALEPEVFAVVLIAAAFVATRSRPD